VKRNPFPSLFKFRYRHARRHRFRTNRVDAGDAGSGPGVGHVLSAFRGLRRRAHRRSLLHRVQINFRACSTRAAGGWPPWPAGKSKSIRRCLRRRPRRPRPATASTRRSCTSRGRCRNRRPALSFYVKLRKGRPLRIRLEGLAHFGVFKDIDVSELRLARPQSTHGLGEKPHCGKSGVPFMYSTTGAADSWLLIRSIALHSRRLHVIHDRCARALVRPNYGPIVR